MSACPHLFPCLLSKLKAVCRLNSIWVNKICYSKLVSLVSLEWYQLQTVGDSTKVRKLTIVDKLPKGE